jgi:glycerol-3-phosphate acyltransferase PlsX
LSLVKLITRNQPEDHFFERGANMAIVLDAMGSDQYPEPELQASLNAAREFGEEVLLVGREAMLAPKLKELNKEGLPIRIVDAPDVLEMTDKPVEAARKKPNTSMAVGIQMVKNGQADAFVTAGNTGGAYFNAVQILKRMPGISRPALTTTIPTVNGRCILIDNGANADCRPEFLLEFGVMGSVYAEKVLGKTNPRVALLSNGEEAGKGNQLVKDSYALLKSSGLNFIGNVEPKEVFADGTDVVVADGFTGNIFMKSSEAVAKFITTILKEEITASPITTLGGLLVKPAFNKLRKMMDPSEVGAAMLVGVNGYVFIGHGRSDAHALTTAMRLAHTAVQSDLLAAINSAIQQKLTQIQSSPIQEN